MIPALLLSGCRTPFPAQTLLLLSSHSLFGTYRSTNDPTHPETLPCLGWTWPVEQRGRALVWQPLSSAVLASCNVIVLWFRHQPAQPSCPSPCWSLSQQRKLSLLGTIRSHFEADDCISKRCCVRLKEASLSERFQRGAFGSTAPETRR